MKKIVNLTKSIVMNIAQAIQGVLQYEKEQAVKIVRCLCILLKALVNLLISPLFALLGAILMLTEDEFLD